MVAKASESKFKPHPTGQYVGQCVDVVDLGEKLQDFPGTPSYLASTCALVFRTGERNEDSGEYIDIAKEFTVSMGDKANLRKFLEQWRGSPYKADALKAGVPLHKLEGQHGLLTVATRTSAKGKDYANITACVGIPKQMANSVTDYLAEGGYQRDEYWTKKRNEYAEAAAKFRDEMEAQSAKKRNGNGETFEDYPDALADDIDDLPF